MFYVHAFKMTRDHPVITFFSLIFTATFCIIAVVKTISTTLSTINIKFSTKIHATGVSLINEKASVCNVLLFQFIHRRHIIAVRCVEPPGVSLLFIARKKSFMHIFFRYRQKGCYENVFLHKEILQGGILIYNILYRCFLYVCWFIQKIASHFFLLLLFPTRCFYAFI